MAAIAKKFENREKVGKDTRRFTFRLPSIIPLVEISGEKDDCMKQITFVKSDVILKNNPCEH